MRRKEKKLVRGRGLLTAIICFTLMFGSVVFAGCEDGTEQPPADRKNYQVELYYVNEAYILEGDESLGRFKPEYEKEILATADDVYKQTLTALSQVPDEEGYATMLKNNIQVIGVFLDTDGKTAIVDLASKGLSGGSMEEGLLVEQIVWTLEESFDEVEQVRFTVDGGPSETLMGHMDVSVPYSIVEVQDPEGGETEMVMPIYD